MADSTSYVPTTDDAVSVYWRPGCPFCMSLDRSLKKAGVPMDKRNIWEDPDAAAFVRSVADGNEVVPTVAVGKRYMVNPSPKEVLAAMAEEAPQIQLVDSSSSSDNPDHGALGRMTRRILGS